MHPRACDRKAKAGIGRADVLAGFVRRSLTLARATKRAEEEEEEGRAGAMVPARRRAPDATDGRYCADEAAEQRPLVLA